MTKVIKSWRQRLADYLQKSEKETKIKDKKQLILNLLQENLTTEESINLFNTVSELFTNKMKDRLEEVSLEKDALTVFLSREK